MVNGWKWNLFLLFVGIYLFIFSLSGLKESWTAAFAVEGKEQLAKDYIGRFVDNPLSGLAVGILATALVQSSSGVVAITIATVAAGGLTLVQAVPLVMGANIGTTVTCVIVTLGYAIRKLEFSAAVPVAIVNDVFKTFNVLIFFFIEIYTGWISRFAVWGAQFLDEMPLVGDLLGGFPDVVDVVVDPVMEPLSKVVFAFGGAVSSSHFAGAIMMGVTSFGLLILGLEIMGRSVESALKDRASELLEKAFHTPLRGLFVGTATAAILQSSSVATSLVVPFAASRMVTLRKAYPYILGCNIGTTIDPGQIVSYLKFGAQGLAVGIVHISLNVFGVVIWLGIPWLRDVPPRIAEWIGVHLVERKNGALNLLVAVVLVFYVIPLAIIYIV
ncbi:MAG: Na/Pi symporter [Candidatus Altiarchaeota archaeon]